MGHLLQFVLSQRDTIIANMDFLNELLDNEEYKNADIQIRQRVYNIFGLDINVHSIHKHEIIKGDESSVFLMLFDQNIPDTGVVFRKVGESSVEISAMMKQEDVGKINGLSNEKNLEIRVIQ